MDEDTTLNTKRKIGWDRHNSVRPAVRRALDADPFDIEALKMALPPMQRMFAEEYIKDFNAADAILRAGSKTVHPEQVGWEMKVNPGVQKYIAYLMDERTANTKVDIGYALNKLLKALERNSGKNATAELRAIELLMKHLGMLTDRTEISGRDGQAIQIEKVEEDADAFARAIASIARRNGAIEGVGETEH